VSSALTIYVLICVGTDWLLKLCRTGQHIRDSMLWFVTLVFVATKLWPEKLEVILPPSNDVYEVITQRAQLAFLPIVICLLLALFYFLAPRLFKLSFNATLVRLQFALLVFGGLLFWSPHEFWSLPGRYVDYPEMLQLLQSWQLAGVVSMLSSFLIFAGLVWRSTRKRKSHME
jgi:hypothetical protein